MNRVKANNKPRATQKNATDTHVIDYLNAIDNQGRREDCLEICEMMTRISGETPKLWGTIVGFGNYHYVYESGREGDSFRTGFANRKQDITLYIMPGYTDFESYLSRLGKHRKGKSCLYFKRLSDIDKTVLEAIIQKGLDVMKKSYPQ